MAQHNDFGKLGEAEAVRLLQSKGYKIRETNYRFDRAEVDVIAQINNTLVVVEVKARASVNFGNPETFVKPKQIKHLIKVIDNYVNKNNLDVDVRFDIITVVKSNSGLDLNHIEDAFYHF